MAIISKIRDKSGIIVFIVGLGLLLFIIPFDQLGSFFSGNGDQPIAEMNGNAVYEMDINFSNEAQFDLDNARRRNPGYSFTEKDILEMENATWGRKIIDTLLQTQFASLGLRVGKKELNEVLIYGETPSTVIREHEPFNIEFGNGQKMFIRDSATKYFENIFNEIDTYTGDQKKIAQYNLYHMWTLPITKARMKEKYETMMKYGVSGTKLEAKRLHKEQNTSAEIAYIYLNYNNIADSLVTVTEKDIKAYYDKNQNNVKYKNDGDVRGFKYAIFTIAPSDKDVEKITNDLKLLIEPFQNAVNDTLFLIANASSVQNSATAIDILPSEPFEAGKNTFSNEIEAAITQANKGDVLGPFNYQNNQKLLIIKIIDAAFKDETEVRHIYLAKRGFDDSENAALKKTGDSIVKVLAADKSKFTELSLLFNKDYSNQTGKIKINKEEETVWGEDFKNSALSSAVGSVKLVASENGYHVVEVLSRGENKYNKIAIVDKDITPTKNTRQQLEESTLLPFITNLEKRKGTFEELALENGVVSAELSRLYLSNPIASMQQLGFEMSIINWAFNRKIGAISDPILIEGNRYFIGQITYVANEGFPDFEAAKDDMKKEVLKEKKAAYAINLIKGATTLDEAASKLPNVSVQSKKVLLSDNSIVIGQTDPMAIAYAFTTPEGAISAPIKGEVGVYMIKVNAKTSAVPSEDLSTQRDEITAKYRSSIESGYIMALYRAADIRDWRMKRKVAFANK